ncbi:uncharacterized protein LOC117173774 [Belonocnema kinseyi]|uniref:uncharacterized protein LOC117173774 n=1 Tax=Belonocnema kinseyi TaxID=2817044 RepID=UPI00143DDB6D|nr:uncharacterized protein LOC117173774 [Belonocnema kinseyi]
MTRVKILQINCNRSYPAYDLALATAKEMGKDVDAAIKVTDPGIVVTGQGKGKGFSYIVTPSFSIYGCYASPNKQVEELEETLEQIQSIMRSRCDEFIVVGDFNAKFPQWGMKTTDKRGHILIEWIAQHDLNVKNVGNKATFYRKEYGSILD